MSRCNVCGAANRVPLAKLQERLQPVCGRCSEPLMADIKPVIVTHATPLGPPMARAVPAEIGKLSKFDWLADGPSTYHLGLINDRVLTVRENTMGQWEVFEHSKGLANHLWTVKTLKEALALAEKQIPPRDAPVLRVGAKWQGDPPTEPQAYRIWEIDTRVRKYYPTPAKFFNFCVSQHQSGNESYSKGGLSRSISALENYDTNSVGQCYGRSEEATTVTHTQSEDMGHRYRYLQQLMDRHNAAIANVCAEISSDTCSEDVIVSCFRTILRYDGLANLAPLPTETPSQWSNRVPLPWAYDKLKNTVERRIQGRYDELRRKNAKRLLYERNQRLVQRFLETAERKVRILDDYGDENWDALPREIDRCLSKIMQHEGDSEEDVKQFLKNERYGSEWEAYTWLRTELRAKFEEYHKSNRRLESTSEADVDRFTGEEYEVYVARILKGLGYEVSGTPRTGDQGADLIVMILGRTIVIQIKRSARPVGNDAVQEAIAALHFYRADEGWVITNATFTPSAKALAQASQIKLIDGPALRRMSNKPADSGDGQ